MVTKAIELRWIDGKYRYPKIEESLDHGAVWQFECNHQILSSPVDQSEQLVNQARDVIRVMLDRSLQKHLPFAIEC
jgi:hypothetical protein